ncbi:unnamed protein product, partial [Amoebophrya sp. A25]|eukprot:GSA25T00008756001.1
MREAIHSLQQSTTHPPQQDSLSLVVPVLSALDGMELRAEKQAGD